MSTRTAICSFEEKLSCSSPQSSEHIIFFSNFPYGFQINKPGVLILMDWTITSYGM